MWLNILQGFKFPLKDKSKWAAQEQLKSATNNFNFLSSVISQLLGRNETQAFVLIQKYQQKKIGKSCRVQL